MNTFSVLSLLVVLAVISAEGHHKEDHHRGPPGFEHPGGWPKRFGHSDILPRTFHQFHPRGHYIIQILPIDGSITIVDDSTSTENDEDSAETTSDTTPITTDDTASTESVEDSTISTNSDNTTTETADDTTSADTTATDDSTTAINN